MKTLKILLIPAIILMISFAFSCNRKFVEGKTRAVSASDVAVVYSSDLPATTAGAAIVMIKYANTDFYNITDYDSADVDALIMAIDTDSYHRIFVFLDTSTLAATYYIQGYLYDSLANCLYNDTTDGIAPDADLRYLASTTTQTKAEVLWDELYPTFTEPLVVQYLGFAEFATRRGRSQEVSTDSTLVDTVATAVVDGLIGDNIYLITGTGIGQTREIYDNTADVFYVTPDWTTNPDKTTYFTVKKAAESNENFYDIYTLYYVLTYLGDFSVNTTVTSWHKLIDQYYNINEGNVYRTTYQDLDYLQNTVLAGGKIIFDYTCQ